MPVPLFVPLPLVQIKEAIGSDALKLIEASFLPKQEGIVGVALRGITVPAGIVTVVMLLQPLLCVTVIV